MLFHKQNLIKIIIGLICDMNHCRLHYHIICFTNCKRQPHPCNTCSKLFGKHFWIGTKLVIIMDGYLTWLLCAFPYRQKKNHLHVWKESKHFSWSTFWNLKQSLWSRWWWNWNPRNQSSLKTKQVLIVMPMMREPWIDEPFW